VYLNTHLRGEFWFGGGHLANLPCFPDVVGEGLFAVDVLVVLQGKHGCPGMAMLTDGDHDGIKIARRLVEHLAEVGELFGIGEIFAGLLHVVGIDIAQGDDVLGFDLCGVCRPAPAGADDGDVQLAVEALSAQECRGGECAGSRRRASGEDGLVETAAGDGLILHCRFPWST
jgi:hypothetical protein